MNKAVVLILACCMVSLAKGQYTTREFSKPDFADIAKKTKDKTSPFYFPQQLHRYTEGDTTLTVEEYRYLYYGFSFREEYSPYGASKVIDQLREVMDNKDLSAADVDNVIGLEKTVLKEYPFNLRNLYGLVNMYDKKNDTVNSAKTYKKLLGVARAILSTGDGLSDSTPFYVISVEHEYDLLGLLDYEFGGSQSLVNKNGSVMDYLSLADNKYLTRGMYFNVDRLFAASKKLFEKN
jgi:hypothetical protein